MIVAFAGSTGKIQGDRLIREILFCHIILKIRSVRRIQEGYCQNYIFKKVVKINTANSPYTNGSNCSYMGLNFIN